MTNFCCRCQLFGFFCKKVNLTALSDTCQAVCKRSSGSRLVVVGQLSDSRQADLRQPFDSFFVVDVNYLNYSVKKST